MRMETPCTDSNDAVCVCDYNYFLDSVSGRCEPCTVCPVGQGVFLHCEYDHDTLCEECLDNTYSERESSLDPCLPCTICDEDTETQLAECTPSSDSVCHSKSSGRAVVGPGRRHGNLAPEKCDRALLGCLANFFSPLVQLQDAAVALEVTDSFAPNLISIG